MSETSASKHQDPSDFAKRIRKASAQMWRDASTCAMIAILSPHRREQNHYTKLARRLRAIAEVVIWELDKSEGPDDNTLSGQISRCRFLQFDLSDPRMKANALALSIDLDRFSHTLFYSRTLRNPDMFPTPWQMPVKAAESATPVRARPQLPNHFL